MNREEYSQLNDRQKECFKMAVDIFGDIPGKVATYSDGIEIELEDYRGLASFDNSYLTSAVIMAHVRGIRAEVTANDDVLKLRLNKFDRHLALDTAIKRAIGAQSEKVLSRSDQAKLAKEKIQEILDQYNVYFESTDGVEVSVCADEGDKQHSWIVASLI